MAINYDQQIALGQWAAINQRNRSADQQAEALRQQQRHYAALQAQFEGMQRAEAERASIEKQRLELERMRLEMEENERKLHHTQADRLKDLRAFLADTEVLLAGLRQSLQ